MAIMEMEQSACIDIYEYAVAIGLGLTVIPIVEIIKLIQRGVAKRREK